MRKLNDLSAPAQDEAEEEHEEDGIDDELLDGCFAEYEDGVPLDSQGAALGGVPVNTQHMAQQTRALMTSSQPSQDSQEKQKETSPFTLCGGAINLDEYTQQSQQQSQYPQPLVHLAVHLSTLFSLYYITRSAKV